MALDVDRYFDRRRLTRALRFWRIAAIVAFMAFVTVLAAKYDRSAGAAVGLIDVHNIIFDDTDVSEDGLEVPDFLR